MQADQRDRRRSLGKALRKGDKYRRTGWIPVAILLCLGTCAAQSSDSGGSSPNNSKQAASSAAPQEHRLGNYVATQSVEFGYRFNEISGAQFACPAGSEGRNSAGLCEDFSMYDTLENYHTGPRLLQQSLSLRAPAGTGAWFDNLSLDSFGFGGDPNNVARLHADRARWYRLDVNFRRDQNFFNYDLLANPLNPPAAGNIPILYSPHYFYTVRRMSDTDVTLAPQSRVSLRLGFNSNRTEGPASSTFHMPRGTDIKPQYLLNTSAATYRAGVDFKFLPRTTISYDQFYTHFKGDNAWQNTMFPFLLAGSPVDLGISWNRDANQPCSPANLFGPRCNLDQSFLRQDRYRTNIRTEQLSFRSRPSSRMDVDGRVAYSSASMGGLYSQSWTGFTASSRQRQDVLTSALGNRLRVGSADLGITVYLSDRLRLLDTLRWVNSRAPLGGLITETAWAGPSGTTALTPVSSLTPETSFAGLSRFWKVESKQNQVEVEYDFTRAVGASLGYRYEKRFLLAQDETRPLTSPSEGSVSGDVETGIDNAELPVHTGLLGVWLRPNEKLRASLDTEFSSAGLLVGGPQRLFGAVNNVYDLPGLTSNAGLGVATRITPRKEQRYRFRLNHNPRRWITMGISANIWNARNDYADVGYHMRSSNAGFNATVTPNERFALDLAYNFNTYRQSNLICPIDSASAPPVVFGGNVTSLVCPFDLDPVSGAPTGLFQTFGRFESVNNFFYALVRARVAPRLTASLGYSLSASDGAQIYTNQLMVAGSLKNDFHRPVAELLYDLSHGWTAKAGWNYYGYGEKDGPGPTLPRNFHANSVTLSTIYAF